MACNLPVVTTRFGSLPDMFQAGDGLFFYENPNDLPGLIDDAIHFLDSHTRDKVSPYTWNKMANRILEGLGNGASSNM